MCDLPKHREATFFRQVAYPLQKAGRSLQRGGQGGWTGHKQHLVKRLSAAIPQVQRTLTTYQALVSIIQGVIQGVTLGVRRVKVLVFSGCNSHPATGSLQPVAIEATRGGNETVGAFETNGSHGDSASRQAVTRVNVEQASKRPM
jgi:hypothetical protein